MIFTILFLVSSYTSLVAGESHNVESLVCVEGYVSDTVCIENEGFLDNGFHPLVQPEMHTAHCLLDVGICRASIEILKDPVSAQDNYTRAVVLDDAGGAMMLSYGQSVGAECDNCTGTQTHGIRATVIGSLDADVHDEMEQNNEVNPNAMPPMLQTHAVLSHEIGCSSVQAEPDFCITGYISDTFCIEQGAFLDNGFAPLERPEMHTAHCLFDVPQCQAGYEILNDDVTIGGEKLGYYSRAVQLDDVGDALIQHYARTVGKDCDGCVGSQEMGIRATVMGVLEGGVVGNSNAEPPVLRVTNVLSGDHECPAELAQVPTMPEDTSAVTSHNLATELRMVVVVAFGALMFGI